MSEKSEKENQPIERGGVKKATSWLVSPRVFIKQDDMKYGIFTIEPIKRLFENISDSLSKLKKQRELVKQHGEVRKTRFSEEEIAQLKQEYSEEDINEVTHHTFNYDNFHSYLKDNNIPLKSIHKAHNDNALWGYVSFIAGLLLLLTGTLTFAGLLTAITPLGFLGKLSGIIMLIVGAIQLMVASHRFYHAKLIEYKILPERVSYGAFIKGKIGYFPSISLPEEFDSWYRKHV